MSVVGWGKTSQGQLGMGGIEESTVTEPRPLKSLQKSRVRVRQIACGHAHTLVLTEAGEVLSCGSNEQGQCGQDISSTRPAAIESLCAPRVIVSQVACGHAHSLALTTDGAVYAWGNNELGQAGVSPSISNLGQPQVVESLVKKKVLQVACGGHHNLALTESGRVFSWGSNRYGQLGLKGKLLNLSSPQEVVALLGLPVLHIAAGDGHSMVVSRSGSVFGWGRNTFGQLGVGHDRDIPDPTELGSLRTQRIRYISCGEKHTAALTEDGGLFTFGCSSQGQLGHSTALSHSTTYPTKVVELMGSTVTQVACGRCHTLAVVQSSGRVYGFGLGTSGQLGTGSRENATIPTPVSGQWVRRESLVVSSMDRVEDGKEERGGVVAMEEGGGGEERERRMVVREVFAGGDQSFASLIIPGEQDLSVIADCRHQHPTCLPPSLNFDHLKYLLDQAFIMKNYTQVSSFLQMVFSHPALLNSSFLSRDHQAATTQSNASGVNVEEALFSMQLLTERLHLPAPLILSNIQLCMKEMLKTMKQYQKLVSPECRRLFLLLPVFFLTPLNSTLYAVFAEALTSLPAEHKTHLGQWLFQSPLHYLQLWLDAAKQSLSEYLHSRKTAEASQNKNPIDLPASHPTVKSSPLNQVQSEGEVLNILKLLKCIHEWNTRHGEVLVHSQFYVPAVNEVVDFVEDFFHWINPKDNVIVFCQYPFVLDPRAKAELLRVESRVQMHIAVNTAHQEMMRQLLFQQMIHDFSPGTYKLSVRRSHLVQDTLNCLVSSDPQNFKKPLMVEFMGEEGMDVGGVQKEFFLLLLKDILNPQFGMFMEDEESKFIWFSEESLLYGSLNYFKLVGIVCGLAIYNSVIIDLPFPAALYKKLLKKPTDLTDLKQLHPSVGNNLESLLTYEGKDFEHTFSLTFELTRSRFGEVTTVPLIPGGSTVTVTMENRTEYVRAYVKYVLDESVKEPFLAFDEGFKRVCDGKVLSMLHPLELMSLVVGQQAIDWSDLEKYMDYKNGYHKELPVIKIFWAVFHELPVEAKRKFLVFWTGSNRIPVAGVESMKMIIQRMDGGRNCERLPVAHTCFNVLDLPPYPAHKLMKQKLLQAINFTSGFGII